MERILVPLDHSTGSEHVIDYASAIALGVGASLTLLHVYDGPNAMIGIVPGATVAGELAAQAASGAAVLASALANVHANGISHVDTILEHAPSASQAIIGTARGGKFDLIVMGTHARTGVSRLVMGSVAEQVLRAATCPVLAVHLPPE